LYQAPHIKSNKSASNKKDHGSFGIGRTEDEEPNQKVSQELTQTVHRQRRQRSSPRTRESFRGKKQLETAGETENLNAPSGEPKNHQTHTVKTESEDDEQKPQTKIKLKHQIQVEDEPQTHVTTESEDDAPRKNQTHIKMRTSDSTHGPTETPTEKQEQNPQLTNKPTPEPTP
jgi:hypothetical protein